MRLTALLITLLTFAPITTFANGTNAINELSSERASSLQIVMIRLDIFAKEFSKEASERLKGSPLENFRIFFTVQKDGIFLIGRASVPTTNMSKQTCADFRQSVTGELTTDTLLKVSFPYAGDGFRNKYYSVFSNAFTITSNENPDLKITC